MVELPPMAEILDITLKNYFLGTLLKIEGKEGEYRFKCGNISTITIIKECIGKQE